MGLFAEKNQVGLYVDTETISVVSGQISGSSINVTGFAELHVPTFLEAGLELKQKTLNDIRTVLGRAGVKSKTILVSVPGDGSMTRHFELPVLPKKEERSAVRFEAQKYVPFEAKVLYYDYETYLDPATKRNRVVYFACKKQWVDSLSAMLTLAGMKISQVELVSQSIARAFHRRATKKTDETTLVITSNDRNTAEFVIQKLGSVLATRHVSLARSADGASLDIPTLVSEVRISLDYFSENFKDLKVERLYLVTPFSGETQTVCDALQRELSLPADSGVLFQPPSVSTSTTAAVAAYGLILAALEKKRPGTRRVSLKPTEAITDAPILSWEEEKKQLEELATKEIVGIAIGLGLLFFAFNNATTTKSQELQKAIASYPAANTAALSESLADLQSKQTLMAQKLTFFNSLQDKRVYFTLKMNAIAKLVPPNVRLLKWNFTDELTPQGTSDIVMRLDGYVLSPDAGSELSVVNKLVSQLNEDKNFMQGFSEIRVGRTSKADVDGQSVTLFTLDCSKKKV